MKTDKVKKLIKDLRLADRRAEFGVGEIYLEEIIKFIRKWIKDN